MRNLTLAIPRTTRIVVMIIAAIAALWLAFEMDQAMQPATDDSDFGIVGFELAGTPDRATEILADWGDDGREGAEQAIKLDYGFLVAYSVLLALATGSVTMIVTARGWERAERIGWVLAGLVLVAGLLDAVENTALLQVLSGYDLGDIGSANTTIAMVAASAKFAFLLVAGFYVVGGLGAVWFSRSRPKRP